MKYRNKHNVRSGFGAVAVIWLLAYTAVAQTTAFTYQGKLTDSGTPANGNYEVQAKLFDAAIGGTQQGSTFSDHLLVTNGNFTVMLNFGANVFTGPARYLEIAVRPLGDPNPFTVLVPRQLIAASPYAINAQQLGGLPASRYVATDANGNVGIGTSGPTAKLDVRGNLTLESGNSPIIYTSTANFDQFRYLQLINSVNAPSASGLKAGGVLVSDDYSFADPDKNDLVVKGRTSLGTTNRAASLVVGPQPNDTLTAYFLGWIAAEGLVGVGGLATGGTTQVCRTPDRYLALCSSSLRYKKDFQPFGDGLSFINQLRPIIFKWKSTDALDIGFGAEDVAKINPLFVTHNSKGEVEGVKYDRLSVVFANALKEQQKQIEWQQQQIERVRKQLTAQQTQLATQRRQMEGLKRLISHSHQKAEVCKGPRRRP